MKGAYLLGVRLLAPLAFEAGRLGRVSLPAGEYLYLGSAQGGLGPRLLRHARRRAGPPHPLFPLLSARFPRARGRKRALFWHVDRLLEPEEARLVAAWWRAGASEAALYARLVAAGARPHPPGFGASDTGDAGHLFPFPHARVGELFPEAEAVSVR